MTLPIPGSSLGTPQQATEAAVARGGLLPERIRGYADSLWDACARLGIRADVAFAQADLETGGFTSTRWTREGNPAGIGIVTNMPDSRTGPVYSPYQWGVIHATHLGGYAGIEPPPTWQALDFRWDAMVAKGWFGIADTVHDLEERWAEDEGNYGDKIVSRWTAYRFTTQESPVTLTFGNVPHPGYIDKQASTAGKPAGVGWDNLGKRDVKGIALHRMWGTLAGTAQHFANPSVGALTDYGIGTANIDGAASDGVIHKYNDPLGYRSGWASGPVSAPYGDGLKFVNKYGVNGVNRFLLSIETSGYDTEPFTDFAWSELVKLIAYWADYARVPYSSLPLNPHTGINFIIWHQEITIGTGKKCPFTWMMQNTDRLYTDVAAYLKPFQTGTAGEPQPKPEPPVVVPSFAAPQPIAALAKLADQDKNAVVAIVETEGSEFQSGEKFVFVGDRVRAIRDTPRLQTADRDKAKRVGVDIAKGEDFDVRWLATGADGQDYYITPWFTRVLVADTERIAD